MKFPIVFVLLLATICGVFADIYLQTFGSNNRLNEQSATRTNNNRLFDSQNNARGGLNVGDKTNAAFNTGNPLLSLDTVYNTADKSASQYPLSFYEGSDVTLAWTAQHGCGGNPSTDPHNLNCNLVIQYTCDIEHTDDALDVTLHNGGSTQDTTAPDANNAAGIAAVKSANDAAQKGRHENEYSYFECNNRERNKGLFVADQNLNNNDARSTRQNANGNRSGLECPEERDYYPYWGPTIWRDVAYLTSEIGNVNVDICKLVKEESQNVKDKCKCTTTSLTTRQAALKYITKETCEANAGVWSCFKHNIAAPECLVGEWTRDNHHGNTREGHYQNYTWTLPTFSGALATNKVSDSDYVKCVARIRYNITTADYDPWNTFATPVAQSPVTNNPTIDLGADRQGLQLALNTAQTGRTFQDRTHIFTIRKRPASLANTKIYNMNTIGKRGNIVQTYPSVEYMFMPNNLAFKTTDYIHIQWTGSNTHNNGANGGDGQTGNDGQGAEGTDRNNIVLTYGEGDNFPIALDKDQENMWKYTKCFVPAATGAAITEVTTSGQVINVNCALIFATSGYFRSVADVATGTAIDTTMNNAPASLVNGVLIQVSKPGVYTFISSRNNNFSNRSQKGRFTVLA